VRLNTGRALYAHASPISGIGYAVVMHDITHWKELDRVKSDLISTVCHDLRTPLTTIQGYIDLLAKGGPLTEQQQEFIARMQHSVSSVAQLVSDLLDMGSIETGFDFEMESADIRAIVTEAVSELRLGVEEKNQSLRIQMPQEMMPIRGHPRRLRQAISNLVDNAVKYTPPGGEITVEVFDSESYITVNVIDSGPGIPLQDQPYVFDKFFRADSPETRGVSGTGLGLSIVKSVVEKHGGRVWLRSTVGSGSTFTLLLPRR